jgi:Zn-dependent protease
MISEMQFTNTEIKELCIAWIGVTAAFSFLFVKQFSLTYAILGSFIGVGSAFVLHELAHKFVAQKYHCYATFKMNQLWIFIGIATAALFSFVLMIPGAVHVRNIKHLSEHGKIAFAGPLTNLILALISAGIFLLHPFAIAKIGWVVNAWLGVLNMIPVAGLDGQKIYSWNKPLFWSVGLALLFLFILA